MGQEPTVVLDSSGIAPSDTPQNKEPMKEGGTKTKEVRQPFPCKVYEMLQDADDQGFQDVVSWNKEGNGFMVHNKERFTNEIVPKYYNQTRYKSFQRQLSLYGFQRTTSGSNKGLRFHEKLRRGYKHLCREMKPIGYKPRGQEQREKQREKRDVQTTTSTVVSDDGGASPSYVPAAAPAMTFSFESQSLPAVISSNSIYKEIPPISQQSPQTSAFVNDTRVTSEITERLITTDSIGFFEGMPFYLMTTVSSEVKKQPITNSLSYQATPTPYASENHQMDAGQMKKAWEIGFAVAMTMNQSSLPTPAGIVPTEVLGTHPINTQQV